MPYVYANTPNRSSLVCLIHSVRVCVSIDPNHWFHLCAGDSWNPNTHTHRTLPRSSPDPTSPGRDNERSSRSKLTLWAANSYCHQRRLSVLVLVRVVVVLAELVVVHSVANDNEKKWAITMGKLHAENDNKQQLSPSHSLCWCGLERSVSLSAHILPDAQLSLTV